MDNRIKELLSLTRKERILISKMVESDEKEDKYLFKELQNKFKEISSNTNRLVKELIEKEGYDESIEYLTEKVNEVIEKKDNAVDLITLVGFINSFYLNEFSNAVENSDSDTFTNEFNMQLYDVYLWFVRENEHEKEFKDALRTDLILKITNSRALRLYYAGDYEKANEISNPLNDEEFQDRDALGTVYASLMLAQINLSNKVEMYEGILDNTSFESRKKMLEIEFVALSVLLMKHGILIPPNTMEISDFTEGVIRNASDILDGYRERNNKGPKKILLK